MRRTPTVYHDCGDDERKVSRSALSIFRANAIKRDRELGRRPKIAPHTMNRQPTILADLWRASSP